MKKTIAIIVVLVVIVAAVCGWLLLGPATRFKEPSKYVYVYHDATAQKEIKSQLENTGDIRTPELLNILANKLHVWKNVKAGRFEIHKGASLLTIVRMLRNNHQASVKLVINKLRTRADLAGLLGKQFRTDSLHTLIFLNSNDSLRQLGVDTNTVMTLVIPDTYELRWNLTVPKILQRLKNYQEDFWVKNNRKQKAAALGLTPEQVYALASIVEEETNMNAEKGNVASVYLNRYRQHLALGADPTIRFALNDFTIKRILSGHLQVQSPYNTYRNKGLPPGPICTPSQKTIDAVLDEPKTNYMYFVAKSDFSGYHHFSTTYAEHLQYAKQYQQALDAQQGKKADGQP